MAYVKFLISLVLLTSAFSKDHNFVIGSSAQEINKLLWRFIALVWGSLWFVQLPSLRALPQIQRKIDDPGFKKTIKWLLTVLILIFIGLSIVSAFDDFIPGYSGKDFFTIMLAPLIH